MTADELWEWLIGAAAGAERVYHIGFLAIDRETDKIVDEAAEAIMRMVRAKQVVISQRRIGPSIYAYVVRKA